MMYNLLQITSCLESTDNIITSCLGLIEIIKPLLNKLIHRTKNEYKTFIFFSMNQLHIEYMGAIAPKKACYFLSLHDRENSVISS